MNEERKKGPVKDITLIFLVYWHVKKIIPWNDKKRNADN